MASGHLSTPTLLCHLASTSTDLWKWITGSVFDPGTTPHLSSKLIQTPSSLGFHHTEHSQPLGYLSSFSIAADRRAPKCNLGLQIVSTSDHIHICDPRRGVYSATHVSGCQTGIPTSPLGETALSQPTGSESLLLCQQSLQVSKVTDAVGVASFHKHPLPKSDSASHIPSPLLLNLTVLSYIYSLLLNCHRFSLFTQLLPLLPYLMLLHGVSACSEHQTFSRPHLWSLTAPAPTCPASTVHPPVGRGLSN